MIMGSGVFTFFLYFISGHNHNQSNESLLEQAYKSTWNLSRRI